MATFHSVKDAVKLFDSGFSGVRHLNKSQEQVLYLCVLFLGMIFRKIYLILLWLLDILVGETSLAVWNEEINKLKEKIKNVEKTKLEALLELEEAKKTVEHLNQELRIRQNMRNDEKGLDLSSTDVSVVSSELSFAKELLQRVAREKTELGIGRKLSNDEKDLELSSSLRVVTSELGFAKESLHRVAEEESELCVLLKSLKLELQNVEKEHSQLKEDEQKENDQAIEKLKKEAEDAKTELLLLEEELKIALFEAEDAKIAEGHARERLKTAETSLLQSDSKPVETKKSGVTELTETEALRACRDETLKKLEMSEKEIEDIKIATQEALKKAEMAKEATIVVDAELKRRRKAASRIMAESKMCTKSLPSTKELLKSKPRTASKDGCLVKC